MSVTFKRGDIFTDPAWALVVPVNCYGVHGAGLAKAFAKKYPGPMRSCKDAFRMHSDDPSYWVGAAPGWWSGDGKLIVCCPTKLHWRDPSKIEYVAQTLKMLPRTLSHFGVKSVAVPALGCGLGGLRWSDVRPVVEANALWMSADGIDVTVYEP